jgi:hypothetical protein
MRSAKAAGLAVLLSALVAATIVGVNAFAASGPPNPTVSGPANPTNQTSATFTFSSSGAASYQCGLDGSALTTCTSPKGYSSLAQGSHTFQVRALDSKGKASGTVSYTWVIDTSHPTLSSIKRADPNPTKASSLHWTVTFGEPVRNVAASNFTPLNTSHLGGSAPTISSVTPSGSSPSATWTVTVDTSGTSGANDGSIELDLTGAGTIQDAAGNSLSTTSLAGEAYRFDTTPPGVPANLSGPDDPTPANVSSPATFSWQTASDGGDTAGFLCRLDGSSYGACTSPKSYTNLDQGAHTFNVVAVDAAGNQSAPATWTWNIVQPVKNWSIAGDAPGNLQPGAGATRLNLSLTNPNNSDLSVQSLSVTVQSVTKASGAPARTCSASDFATSSLSGTPITLPSGTSTLSDLGVPSSQWPTIRMVDTGHNQDACKGANLTLAYEGVATK